MVPNIIKHLDTKIVMSGQDNFSLVDKKKLNPTDLPPLRRQKHEAFRKFVQHIAFYRGYSPKTGDRGYERPMNRYQRRRHTSLAYVDYGSCVACFRNDCSPRRRLMQFLNGIDDGKCRAGPRRDSLVFLRTLVALILPHLELRLKGGQAICLDDKRKVSLLLHGMCDDRVLERRHGIGSTTTASTVTAATTIRSQQQMRDHFSASPLLMYLDSLASIPGLEYLSEPVFTERFSPQTSPILNDDGTLAMLWPPLDSNSHFDECDSCLDSPTQVACTCFVHDAAPHFEDPVMNANTNAVDDDDYDAWIDRNSAIPGFLDELMRQLILFQNEGNGLFK